MSKSILNYDDLLIMLDNLLREPKEFWEEFYTDRNKEIPFFKIKGPDENLVEYFEVSGFKPSRVLELGCGPGRNAIYMAKRGCFIDALDISMNAISWAKERAKERAKEENVDINFHCRSLFDFAIEPNTYDFVYDCGLFHHLAPHRRITYIEILKKALKKDGYFGLVCFNTDGAIDTPDFEVYNGRSLNRGIGYTEDRLREIFKDRFDVIDFRRMKKVNQPSEYFGEDFLWATLMQVR